MRERKETFSVICLILFAILLFWSCLPASQISTMCMNHHRGLELHWWTNQWLFANAAWGCFQIYTFLGCVLQVSNVRLPNENGRQRGFGYVEFATKEALINALSVNEEVRHWTVVLLVWYSSTVCLLSLYVQYLLCICLFVFLEIFHCFSPWLGYSCLSQHPLLWFSQEPWSHSWLRPVHEEARHKNLSNCLFLA